MTGFWTAVLHHLILPAKLKPKGQNPQDGTLNACKIKRRQEPLGFSTDGISIWQSDGNTPKNGRIRVIF